MYPHRIRLRGPWECEPLVRQPQQNSHADAGESLPSRCTMTMPCRWGPGGLGDFAGRVRFQRRFGVPRRMDSFERVWLTFAGVESRADVWLNGQLLGHCEDANEPFEFEVTEALQERNLLIVEVESDGGNGGLWGEVALEIRCAVFLKDVRLWATWQKEHARLHAAGKLVGQTDLPLELYVVLDRFTVAYQAVKANDRSFEIKSEPLPPERWRREAAEGRQLHTVSVDLVQAGLSWYTTEQTFAFVPAAAIDGGAGF